ncbi:hypothetical protein [Falsiroseomonas sp. CW058]|uniref:hypothetical protein n=1 Tax=Falsiroseomonas sp. CW058 TaxID=3388664 RepID=UPI003D30F17D
MGWWETRSNQWECCVVAQVGAAAVLGGGVFFLQFRRPQLTTKPVFLALAGGAGIGGSIGSAVSIPWSDVVRQLINPQFRPPTDTYGWSNLDGGFSPQDIQRSSFSIISAGASAVVVGAQVAVLEINDIGFSGVRTLCRTRLSIPSNLPAVGRALLDTPQMQGGLGAGAFAFTGAIFYIGVS